MYKLLLQLFVFPLLTSSHHTYGTEYLVASKYDDAIDELTKAVVLYPNLANHHNHLVCAYIARNEWDQAWYYARQAVLCSMPDNVGTYYFDFFCNTLIHGQGLDAVGTDVKEILKKLGIPDMAMYGLDGHTLEMCTYGLLSIKFKNSKLVECRRLDQVKS